MFWREMTDKGNYFVFNRARQYALQEHKNEIELLELFEYLSEICRCSEKPVVFLIDEVDSASNNQVFLDFLAQLRGYYINRDVKATFHSVILAGVYDIRNIKLKLRAGEDRRWNSPWNIAVDFQVDMSFSAADIEGMLKVYEADHRTGMDITKIAGLIYDYTSGYPFLVSYICKLIDERRCSSAIRLKTGCPISFSHSAPPCASGQYAIKATLWESIHGFRENSIPLEPRWYKTWFTTQFLPSGRENNSSISSISKLDTPHARIFPSFTISSIHCTGEEVFLSSAADTDPDNRYEADAEND